MYFESLNAALSMGGHGTYVWTAYGITVLVLLLLVVTPYRKKRRLLRELRGEYRRESAQQDAAQSGP
ncbi:MAG: heme exporter protein CcmD [Pseudomonadota bacterium]